MATSEYQIINKVLDTKDYGIIYNNEIDENNFIMCKDEFNYIKDFYDKYKEVPDKETFCTAFPNFEIFKVSQSDKSIIDDLRENTLFQKAVKIINGSTELFEQNANKGVEYLLAHIHELEPTYEFSCTDIIHDTSRLQTWKDKIDNPTANYIELPFKELNNDLYGFQRGDELFLWLAKSGIGKSQILSICIEHASKQGYRVGVISPEMSTEGFAYRFDTSRTHFSNTSMQKGMLIPKYEEYIDNLKKSDEFVYIADEEDFKGDITMQKVERFIRSKKLDIIFIDGIQYIRLPYVKGMTESQKLGKICRELKVMSVLYHLPVVGAIQARRRENEKRSEDESISDSESVYNSYEITQAATRIVSINRVASALKLYIAKNRYGIEGKSYLYNYDFDRLLLTYIPDIDDIQKEQGKLDKQEQQKQEKENKDMNEMFKHIF